MSQSKTYEPSKEKQERGFAPPVEPELLYDVSEQRLRKLKPQSYTEVFVPRTHGGFDIVGVQDTTEIERDCREIAKNSPDLRLSANKDSSKTMLMGRIPGIWLQKYPDLMSSDRVVLWKAVHRFFGDHPEFLCSNPRTFGIR